MSHHNLAHIRDVLIYETTLYFMLQNPNLLWLHAGVVATEGQALIVCGKRGCGKSTITTLLTQAGWEFLSDDIIPFDPATGLLIPFPVLPRVRMHVSDRVPEEEVGQLRKKDVIIPPDRIGTWPLPPRMIIFPTFEPNHKTVVSPCEPGMAAMKLIANCLNFKHHREKAIGNLVDLSQKHPSFNMNFKDADDAVKKIKQIMRKHVSTLK